MTRSLDHRLPFDLAKAKALMEDPPVSPKASPAELECTNDRYMNDEAVCTAVAAMLAKINVTIGHGARAGQGARHAADHEPSDRHVSAGLGAQFLGFLRSLLLQPGDPVRCTSGDGAGPQQGLFNMGRYSNPDGRQAAGAASARSSIPPSASRRSRRCTRSISQDIPNIPLYQQFLIWGARKSVEATPSDAG